MKIKKNDKLFKCLLTINALLVLLIFSTTNVFADFYVIAGSRGVGTKINSLPYTIASSGFYFIDKDLSCAAGNHGIEITADNVTLDFMGFNLVGPGGSGTRAGIYMDGRTNVEIRNGTVRNFNFIGIYEINNAGRGHRIINVRLKNNYNNGINLQGNGHLVEKCTAASNSGAGIDVHIGSTVAGNTCYDNSNNGIHVYTGSTVTGNTCYSNDADGIDIDYCSTVTGNICYDNSLQGIFAGTGSTVIGNTCNGNTGYGIYLVGNNFVDQNTAINNTGVNMNDPGTCTFGSNHTP